MVAVKTLWVLWKSFSTNFTFSTNNGKRGSADTNRDKDRKGVKYNRLRPIQSHSSHFPSTRAQSPLNQTLTKSQSYDSPRNQSNNEWKSRLDDSDSEYEDNREGFSLTISPEDFSDFDDEDEALTCDVCDRSFSTAKRLADHQEKKRHYGCLECDSIFPSKESLDLHRKEMDHYSFLSDYESDTTSYETDEEGIQETQDGEPLI